MNAKSIKPLLFITNDDGIYAKGLKELIEGVRVFGEIIVVAPERARSGMSGSITTTNPIRVELIQKEENITVYSCSGTPVDCVKLGVNALAPRRPDILVAGINHGSNSAVCVIYSGTIGAVLEGCILGIPSLGISLSNHSLSADFTQSVLYGKKIIEKILSEGFPKGICLNLNIPYISKVKGLKICSQTKGRWQRQIKKTKDPLGREIYWLTGEFVDEELDNPNCDEWALSNGYASLVPLKIDMTAYSYYNQWKNEDYFSI